MAQLDRTHTIIFVSTTHTHTTDKLRLHLIKFLRICKQSGDFFFGFKVAVYTEVTSPVQKIFGLHTNPDKCKSWIGSEYFE